MCVWGLARLLDVGSVTKRLLASPTLETSVRHYSIDSPTIRNAFQPMLAGVLER
jgi:hypothetical protein